MLDMKIGKRRLLTAMGAAVVLAAVTGPEAWAADAKGDPEQWIVEISNKILADIRTDAQLSQADPARVRRFVDEQIMPVVDFERMTRTAVEVASSHQGTAQRTHGVVPRAADSRVFRCTCHCQGSDF